MEELKPAMQCGKTYAQKNDEREDSNNVAHYLIIFPVRTSIKIHIRTVLQVQVVSFLCIMLYYIRRVQSPA